METLQLKCEELSVDQFNIISAMVKRLCGINLHDGKKDLVKARLNKRLRYLKLRNFDQYLNYLDGDSGQRELVAMLDALSTNLTSFFREPSHFEHLSERIIPLLLNRKNTDKTIRIWSAGCSSGEEPYSLAIALTEAMSGVSGWDVRVLATDISTKVLAKANAGIYEENRFDTMPPQLRNRYFTHQGGRGSRQYQISPEVKNLITFGRLNLMEAWPMKGPFDVIFCRNVMIYFDKPTQGMVVQRFEKLLRSGGTLFLGHSESLTGIDHNFKYVQPTVYQKS